MPRPRRIQFAGGVFHVTQRGTGFQPLFLDQHDYAACLKLLRKNEERHGWIVIAYCLMPNHFHLVLETPRPNLARGMQYLQGIYMQRFNRRYGRRGHPEVAQQVNELAPTPGCFGVLG